MMQVHHDGKSVVATGPREEAERHTLAMHSYGLWATFQKADQA
jgi:ATP-dependent Clp protease adaptor protein ClpS